MQADAELRSQILELLDRFSRLVFAQNRSVLDDFADDEAIKLVGSDDGEVASGRQEIEAFFRRIFASRKRYAWEWASVDVSHKGDVAWVFAEGRAQIHDDNGQRAAPYRLSAVMIRQDHRWRWHLYHGSEPVAAD